MRDVTVDQRRAYIGAHTAGYCRPLVVKVTSQPSVKMANSSLVAMLVVLYVSVVSADQMYCSMVAGRVNDGTRGTWKLQVQDRVTVKVKGPKTMNSTRPEQQCRGAEAELEPSLRGEDLCLVLCLLLGYGAGVIEMLLMMSGDVEPNPGPDGILGPKDLAGVLTELLAVCADWYNIGLALEFEHGILDAMKVPQKEPKDCLRDMLKEWLNTSRDPCWKGLVQALRHPIVKKEALARHLETKYCTKEGSEPSPGAGPVQSGDVVQSQTEAEVRKLEAEFDSLVGLAREAVRRQKLKPEKFKKRFSQDVLFKYLLDRLGADNVMDIWDTLSTYWDFFKYSILNKIISQFGDHELKQKMKEYVGNLDNFKKKTKLGEFVQVYLRQKHVQKETTQWVNELKVKKDPPGWESYSLKEVERNMLTSNPKNLIFKEVTKDCACITWLVEVSSSEKSEMESDLLSIHCDFFKDNGITEVVLDGDIYYSKDLESFEKDLRDMYKVRFPEFLAHQWPPPPTRKVFNLAMVQSEEPVRRQQPDEEVVRLMVRGNISNIVERSAKVELKNLLKLDHDEHKVILIEGAPGAGKSTLAWHICQKWKDKEMFQEVQIVIYVQLRDPYVHSAESLTDLLPTEEERKHVLTLIEACRGRRVLFVLDGWDEFEPGLRKGSLIHKLICNPHELHVHHSTLLITSRPLTSRKLQRYASSRVEILGFLPSEVTRYFEEALGDPQAVQNLQEQLKERPVIEASCYLPLNAAIVAHLFKELHEALPTTLHGVFSAVVCGCIRRYLKKKSEEEVEIPALDELPPDVQEDFKRVCSLAYEGSRVNKVTFTGQDLELRGLSAKQNVLDLMQVVQSYASRNSKLCHFLHLSVQELLTALKISKLDPSKQVRIFNETFNNPRFAAVFQFYAAFTELKTEGIRDIIARIARSRDIQSLLNLMNCLYEAQSASLCCFVASQLKGELNLDGVTLSPLNWLSVGFFLSCLCQYPNEHFTVDLTMTSLDCDNVRFLAKGLSNDNYGSLSVEQPTPCVILKPIKDGLKYLFQALVTNRSVVQLQLSHCHLRMTKDICPVLEEMLSKNSLLQVLTLAGNSIGAIGFGYIAKGLRHNTGLEKLSLRDCSLEVTEDNGPLLEEMLSKNKSLKELDLKWNSIGAIGFGCIANRLRHNTGLVKLSLCNCSLEVTEDNGLLLEEMLSKNKSLKELDLGWNSIGAIGFGYIAKGLRHNTGLEKLSLYDCSLEVTGDNGPLLEEMLSKNKSLKELDLQGNSIQFGAIGFEYIAKGLSHNTGLVKLSLYNCSLEVTEDNRPLLEEMLRNSTLQELYVSEMAYCW